jgi:Domain of unknown function (DUF3883)
VAQFAEGLIKMAITLNNARFEMAHESFKRHMQQQSNGIPFINFQHPFLFEDEIRYKLKVYALATDALKLEKWRTWSRSPGKIIRAAQDACKPNVSQNLLVHKYGFENSSERALYKVSASDDIVGLEKQLYDFFLGGPTIPEEFAVRFDGFAEYLRTNHLGCNWSFVAYLAFLLQPQFYFPIRPSRFDELLKYYGVDQSISGHVSWERYSILLQFAEALKSKLAVHGNLNAIEIQSYMWEIGDLIEKEKITSADSWPAIDLGDELRNRIQRAGERERIGLLGEQFVYEQEKTKLASAARPDLASKVSMVSAESGFGFDILSFTPSGQELHIEVKTTTRSQNYDDVFWLSDYEKQIAEQDEQWTIYRVWSIDTEPTYAKIGNVIRENPTAWELTASSWYVRRKM